MALQVKVLLNTFFFQLAVSETVRLAQKLLAEAAEEDEGLGDIGTRVDALGSLVLRLSSGLSASELLSALEASAEEAGRDARRKEVELDVRRQAEDLR